MPEHAPRAQVLIEGSYKLVVAQPNGAVLFEDDCAWPDPTVGGPLG